MTTVDRYPSRSYIECARRLRQLHELMQVGEGDSEAADALRDQMDMDWKMMRDEERGWTGELSADLYSLGGPLPPPNEHFFEWSESHDILNQLTGQSDPAKIRRLLDRETAKKDPAMAALIRAIYWWSLGDFLSAVTFSMEYVRLKRQEAEAGGCGVENPSEKNPSEVVPGQASTAGDRIGDTRSTQHPNLSTTDLMIALEKLMDAIMERLLSIPADVEPPQADILVFSRILDQVFSSIAA